MQAASQDTSGPSQATSRNKKKKNPTTLANFQLPGPGLNPVPVVESPNNRHLNIADEEEDLGVEPFPGLTNGFARHEPGTSSNLGPASPIFKVPVVQATSRKSSKRK